MCVGLGRLSSKEEPWTGEDGGSTMMKRSVGISWRGECALEVSS